MKVRQPKSQANKELPLQLHVSFKKVYDLFKLYASKEYIEHPFYKSSKVMVAEIDKFPELINGFSDLSLLKKHQNKINLLLDVLFPEILSSNEIKSAIIPFNFTTFKFTDRFENIIQNAGKDYELLVRNMNNDDLYIVACTMILSQYYHYPVDLKRPFFFDIPDKKTGIERHYRVAFNADFIEIEATKNAPIITDKDIKILLDSFGNIEVWKEKFPPNSYIFKGFGIINLFDVTVDENMSKINKTLLRSDIRLEDDLRNSLAEFYNIKDLKIGYSMFNTNSNNLKPEYINNTQSLILNQEEDITCKTGRFFCNGIINKVFKNAEAVAISNVKKYGKDTNYNPFYYRLKENNIGSIILLPLKTDEIDNLLIIEIASPRPFELNSINLNKLFDLIPVFESASKRSSEEYMNTLEATIQEHYTSIHPTVKWRFYEAAENYQKAVYKTQETIDIDEIVFSNVHPLFGQSDIKGSSIARNVAIEQDLITQLSLAINVLYKACKTEKLPIYEELIFRIEEYLTHVKKGLKAGDEIGILDFLKQDIYPVFNHIKSVNKNLEKLVSAYTNRLDPELNVVYEKRKAYEKSVTILNDRLSNFIDNKQKDAQKMFPHYFERYKTDGVEYNMYIGQSLVKNRTYNDVYLFNLRLWQLQLMYQMENVAMQATQDMEHELRVASLILVHSNPLAIKFRMDEKQFDVDGAYNIRYEIIKKRIDKAHIKGTEDRLTIPGKIAIVYSQEKDKREYLKYLKYLQSQKMFGKIEELDLEDLQGVSGLKALRVKVNYHKDFYDKKAITLDELIEEFN